MEEKTHVYFDGKKIIISPNLREIFQFLIEIDEEVKNLLSYQKNKECLKEQIYDFFGAMAEMKKIIEENNLDFHFQMREHPKTILEKLELKFSSRSEMIVLFAFLETLRFLWTAYEENTFDRNKLRNAGDEKIDNFFKLFCLSSENKWVKNNSKRAGKISVSSLRLLRNSLTHSFSVPKGLGIGPNNSVDLMESLAKKINNKSQFLSADDLQEIIEGAFVLIMRKWTDEYLYNTQEFEKRIKCVNKIIEKDGAKIMYQNQFSS